MVRESDLSAAQNNMMSLLSGGCAVTELSTDQVDPLIGQELVKKAIISLALPRSSSYMCRFGSNRGLPLPESLLSSTTC